MVSFCFLLWVVNLEVRTHFLFVWEFCTLVQPILITLSINPEGNGYNPDTAQHLVQFMSGFKQLPGHRQKKNQNLCYWVLRPSR